MISYKISKELTAYDALVQIESNRQRSLIVMDNEKVCGTLSDGDIRRAIINRVLLDVKIKSIMNLEFQFVGKSATEHEIKERLKHPDIFILPQIDENKKLIKIHF